MKVHKMAWYQHLISLPSFERGFHLVTNRIVESVPELAGVQVGLLHIQILHTSASLTINENADSDVPRDLEMAMNTIVPEDLPFIHTIEGPDDMPAHIKSSMMGSSVTVAVSDGRLVLGTWQGIYLCEHRNRGGNRKLVLTLQGE